MYRKIELILLGISGLLGVAVSFCYYLRPDACAAVTFFPAWFWLFPGLLLALLGWNRQKKKVALIVVLIWFLYLLAFVEETKSLTHFQRWTNPNRLSVQEKGQVLRVVSLNCAGGNSEAAAEVMLYAPDIVLLQESPEQKKVKDLALKLFGEDAGVVCGVDVSIIARGKVQSVSPSYPRRILMTQARVHLTSGIKAHVVCLHLTPPVFRFDLWSPTCWKAQTEDRRMRRREIQQIAAQVALTPQTVPVILGGDFNVSAGDNALRSLQPRLHDTFREGGIGWGNTATNDTPVLRIDQVWASEHFQAMAVLAKKTIHSDHRLVVCDLVLRSKR